MGVRSALLPTLLVLGLLGCGGRTNHGGAPADAGQDGTAVATDAAGNDAGSIFDSSAGDEEASPGCGFSCDAGAATVCPAAPPAPGAPCVAPRTCEYGSSWFLTCNAVFRCQPTGGAGGEQGTWVEEFDGGTCPWLDAGAGCPATWDEAQEADAGFGECPFTSCVYPEGFCGCGVMCGGGGGIHRPRDVTGIFACIPSVQGCPEPRPLGGTPCTGTASCSYGFNCGCGQIQQCSGGYWSVEPGPPCP